VGSRKTSLAQKKKKILKPKEIGFLETKASLLTSI